MEDYYPPLAMERLPYSLKRTNEKGKKVKIDPTLFPKVICPKSTGSVFLYDCKNYCKCRTQECEGARAWVNRPVGSGLIEELSERIREESEGRLKKESEAEEKMSGWNWPDDPEKEPF